MRSAAQPPAALALGLLAGALALGGCGSGKTQTVSVPSAGAPSATGARTTTGTRTSSRTTPPKIQAGSGGATGASRTAPRPAFTQSGGAGEGGEGLQAALATVKAHGFTAGERSQYRPDHTLRVLIGTRTGSGDGYGQQAFFFVNGRYIGTDTSEPSASIKVVGQGDTEVTLAYPLYRPHDPLCCPGGGQASVRFQLDNGRLVPLDPIPPASSASRLSRQ